jgi:hypothetical protein
LAATVFRSNAPCLLEITRVASIRPRRASRGPSGLNPTSHVNRFFTISGFRHLKLTKGEIFDQHLASIIRIINDQKNGFVWRHV